VGRYHHRIVGRFGSGCRITWIISEGGKDFNAAMPAFKEALSEKQKWKIIQFLRTL